MADATVVDAAPIAPADPRLCAPAAWHERVRAARCAAVVVHFRDADETLACVASLRAHAPQVPVLVVDNDGAAAPQLALARLATGDGHTALLVCGANLGFGGGCNAGFDALLAVGPALAHVLLLNPDARATAGMVEHLCATAAAHPDAGIVGGRILSPDGTRVQFENGRLRPFSLSRMHCRAPAADRAFATTFVTGALMLVDADMLRGGLRFDPRFFLYVEDLDLCCEVRARRRSLWIDPRAVAHHRGGGCWRTDRAVLGALTPGQVYWLARSKILFAAKRSTTLQRWVHLALATLVKPLVGLAIARSARFWAPHFRGIRDGLRQLRALRLTRGAT